MRAAALLSLVAALALGYCAARGAPPAPSLVATKTASATNAANASGVGSWKLETLELTDGRRLEGYVRGIDERGVDFVEVRRPTGRPMFLVVRRWPAALVKSTQRLSGTERAALGERIERFSNRRLIEDEELAAMELTQATRDGLMVWRYKNGWLTLDSTTDEDTTRRAVMRLDHVLAAYTEILPPRIKSARLLEVLLFGATADYRRYCQGLGLAVANPSIYLPEKNLLVAGSDLADYQRQHEQVRERQRTLRNEYRVQAAKMRILLEEISADLADRKVSPAERKKIVAAARAKLEQQLADLARRGDVAERQNQLQFEKATHEMFARLTHEAFHAYLENAVFPQREFAVPRWLNEGLAQMFEEGQLDVGTLRLDTPGQERLEKLAADLRGPTPLALADILSAEAGKFLVGHGEARQTSERHYLYSWGLAYYLAFRQNALARPELEAYVQPAGRDEAKSAAIGRFEKFVGHPLPEFEKRWRAAMVDLAGEGRGRAGDGH